MSASDLTHPLAVALDFLGSLVVLVGVARAVAASPRGTVPAAAALTAGVLAGLGVKTAGTLVKTAELRSWQQIGLFAAVLGLRLALKRAFAWQAARLKPPAPAGR